MPTPLESTLWGALYAKQYPEVKALLESEANLINAVDEDTEYNLPICLIQTTMNPREVKPTALLSYVLTHQKMNWGYATSDLTAAQSLLDAVHVDGDFSVIKSLKDVADFILSNNKLTYVLAADLLKNAEKTHKERVERKKPQPQIDEALGKVEKCKTLLTLIRDITILHAIKTDNTDLIDRLEQMGEEPLEKRLGDFAGNKIPSSLIGVDQANPKIKAWRIEQLKGKTAGRDEQIREVNTRVDRLAFFRDTAKQTNAIHDAKAIAILEQAGAERKDRLRSTVAQLS